MMINNKNMTKNRFATKVVLVILIVTLIPTLFNSIFFYLSSSNIIKENVRESSIQTTRQAADSLSNVLTAGSDISNLIYSNKSLQEIVKADLDPELSEHERHQNNNMMNSFLNAHIQSNSHVQMIYILREEGTSWVSRFFHWEKFYQTNLSQLDWAIASRNLDGELYWEGLQFEWFSGLEESTELVLPISRVMKDFDTLNNIAYIQVFLDGETVLDTINEIKLGRTGRFFVVDQQGNIMIDSNIDKINETISNEQLYDRVIYGEEIEFEYVEGGLNYYGVKQPLANGWTIVGVVPIKEITGQLLTIQTIVILSSITFGIAAILIGLFFANRVTKPIKVLTNQMKLVGEGDFNVRTNVQTSDEIGMMSMEFNRMLEKLEHLMELVKSEQVQKKEAELRAVKHRINPHFLFNTLSTVRWLVNFKQFDRANMALSALTRLLEANMGKKGTFVSVKEEIEIIEKFIDIMQIRYEQIFQMQLDVDLEVNDFLIPQMLLQPIVENAIFHGIVPTDKEGIIKLSGRKIDDGVEIVISDNGIGMEKEKLNKIQQAFYTPNRFVGIGFLHVFESVKLYYASDSLVKIDSSINGTTVTLVIKLKR
ncbi:sensor histidine kinase [Halalkalibacter flavus]|uniref:sensor histidine kinase n=1 Tax=Halalkalibacter flavus TaxID=3090668 RepID=UPI002FC5C45A